jgi:hypothetical protein
VHSFLLGVVNTHQCDDADPRLVGDNLSKIVASFSSKPVIVCINYDHQSRIPFNLCALNKHRLGTCLLAEKLMPRFYFNLSSKDAHIPDESGKEHDTLHDAYVHARKLIDKILFRVGHEDAEAWKVVILNDHHDAQMIVPFSVSHAFRSSTPERISERRSLSYVPPPDRFHSVIEPT